MKKLLLSCLFISTFICGSSQASANSCISCCTFNCGETPLTVCCPPCWYGKLFITADYLHWKAREDGLAYAITGLKNSDNTPPLGEGGTFYPDFKSDSGFRVGAGYLLPCLCWDVTLNYTRFNTHASDDVTVPTVGGSFSLWEVWGPPAGGTFVTNASSEWDLHFQTLDLEVGRSFCYGNYFVFRPYGGLTGVWTDDDYDVVYSSLPDFFQNIHNGQDFSGVGPRVGILSNWNVFQFLSLFTDFSLAGVWGRYSVERVDVVQTTATPSNAAVWVNTGDDFSTVRSIFDFKIGARADLCLCNRLHVFAKVAYETLIFFKHNQFMRFTEGDINIVADTNIGNYWNVDKDLTFHGLTVSFGVGF